MLDDLLVDRKVDFLYAADTRRSQQTAAPVANEFKLPINVLASSDWSGLASRIRREHRGKTVVVVGYATTLPGVINQLSGQELAMRDDEFDAMYVVMMPSPARPECCGSATARRARAQKLEGASNNRYKKLIYNHYFSACASLSARLTNASCSAIRRSASTES